MSCEYTYRVGIGAPAETIQITNYREEGIPGPDTYASLCWLPEKGFLLTILTAGMIGCVLLAKWNINFLADGFVDNSKFLSVRGNYYAYEEIQRIYYRPDRVNGLGETIPYDSYVVQMKNGEEIDLYELSEISDYDPVLLDYLQDKGIPIQRP